MAATAAQTSEGSWSTEGRRAKPAVVGRLAQLLELRAAGGTAIVVDRHRGASPKSRPASGAGCRAATAAWESRDEPLSHAERGAGREIIGFGMAPKVRQLRVRLGGLLYLRWFDIQLMVASKAVSSSGVVERQG